MSIIARIGAALPSLDPLARLTDAARMGLIDEVLASHAADVDECRALLSQPSIPVDAVDAVARRLLGDLRATGPFGGLDALVRSDGPEILDGPDIDAGTRKQAMERLEALNESSGAHALFTAAIEEVLGEVSAPRIYELAAGTGGLARTAGPDMVLRRPKLRWTISDIDESGLGKNGDDPEWLRVEARDALAIESVEEVDLFLCVQAAHHLPPGVVVGLLARSARARLGVLVLDVHRGGIVAGVAGAAGALLGRNRIVAVDGLRSARRAFTPAELALLARVAGLRVLRAGPLGPAYAVLHAVG